MTRGVDRATGLLLLLGLGAAVALCLLMPAAPKIVTDSPLYLQFSGIVPAGYPLFVALFGLSHLVQVQLALLAGAATLLAAIVQRVFRSLLLSVAILIAMLGNPQILDFQRSVVSEALFIPIDIVLLAVLLLYLDTRRPGLALSCAVLAGVGVATRPITFPLVVAVLIVVLLRERSDWRRAVYLTLACAIAWIGVVGGEKAYSRWRQGDQLTSLTGLHLYAKASLIDAPPIDRRGLTVVERRLADAMETRYEPVRVLLARSRGSVAYQAMLAHYEICIQRDCTRTLRAQSGMTDTAFNDAMRHVGWLRVKENPLDYMRLALEEFRSLWMVSSRTHPWRAQAFDAYIAARRPLPLEGEVNASLTEPTVPSTVAFFVRPAIIAAGMATAAMILIFGWLLAFGLRGDVAMLAALGCALMTEFVFVFTSVAGVGDGRYTMGMWPNMACGVLLGMFVTVRAAARWQSGRT